MFKFLMPLVVIAAGCVSNQDRFSDVVEVKAGNGGEERAATVATGLVDYDFKGKKFKAEWLACQQVKAQGTFLVINRDQAAFTEKDFCRSWEAQAFLTAGFNVLAVNRPGYGNSTGPDDFAGEKSLIAVKNSVDNAKQKLKPAFQIDGVWGHSSGAIVASFYAKANKDTKWLVLGSGIYDLELTFKDSQDERLKKRIAGVVAESKDDAYEKRSISWDFSGLPKNIFLYHGKDDVAVNASQASSFRDTLATEEYRVSLLILEKTGHEIPTDLHRGVLGKILKEQLKPASH